MDVDNVFATHDEDALREQLEARKKILEQAKGNIVDAQQKQKAAYDRKHATSISIVLHGKGAVGPYTITWEEVTVTR